MGARSIELFLLGASKQQRLWLRRIMARINLNVLNFNGQVSIKRSTPDDWQVVTHALYFLSFTMCYDFLLKIRQNVIKKKKLHKLGTIKHVDWFISKFWNMDNSNSDFFISFYFIFIIYLFFIFLTDGVGAFL